MLVLGIETSCDETAAAVVSGDKRILSNCVLSQLADHTPYGGVVPEIAARAHIQQLDHIVSQAMLEAQVNYNDLAAVAVTGGPGLIGGVMVGLMMAKAIASYHQKPLLAVNHLEAHALTARLTSDMDYPFLLLLVSGGHCLLLSVEAYGKYNKLGSTKDDALGEAFDKVAKMIGLPYPGGPQVEKLAQTGNPYAYALPKPLVGTEGCDFSFSGLKTAVSRLVGSLKPLNDQKRADICASFQFTVSQILHDRVGQAMQLHERRFIPRQLVVAGGVAANQYLKAQLQELCSSRAYTLIVPPPALCTDNAAMIAWAGVERLLHKAPADDLFFQARARWPLS